MSFMITPISDLSVEDVWHFLIIVLESLMILIDWISIDIPNFLPSKHANASAANGEETLLWRVDFKTRSSPVKPQTTRLVADLKFRMSNATLNWIVILDMSFWPLWFLFVLKGFGVSLTPSFSAIYLCIRWASSLPVFSFLSWMSWFLENQISHKAIQKRQHCSPVPLLKT